MNFWRICDGEGLISDPKKVLQIFCIIKRNFGHKLGQFFLNVWIIVFEQTLERRMEICFVVLMERTMGIMKASMKEAFNLWDESNIHNANIQLVFQIIWSDIFLHLCLGLPWLGNVCLYWRWQSMPIQNVYLYHILCPQIIILSISWNLAMPK